MKCITFAGTCVYIYFEGQNDDVYNVYNDIERGNDNVLTFADVKVESKASWLLQKLQAECCQVP